MFWALVFFGQTGLDWFHFLQWLDCGWAFVHNHQTLPWGCSVTSPQCRLLGFIVWLCGIHWGTPVWGSFMAKSAPFFPCSTLFLADDFHFELLSLLFTGCFSHNPPCSIYGSHLVPLLIFHFRTIVGALDSHYKTRIYQAASRSNTATRYKIKRGKLFCYVFQLIKEKEVQNGTFTKPFLTECRRAA